MEPLYIVAFGVLIAVSAYLLMSRNLLRIVLGLLLLGNAANLSIFIAGRLGPATPPLVAAGEQTIAASANPLPQALILTAIVISFALVAFTVVLFERAQRSLDTIDVDDMRVAEPRKDAAEPAPTEQA
ncbi:cation:proton antiporter [Verticiella sediminum]|uniref:Cation:proton antiporter n=1 Tax=Verticiella sediminum TaxID=1247510 RepID=A0A556AKN1_9BURK|nr:NADH-quinone oxidoreductase subunit K [Verticiella sediminum]TSH93448.1 cation:proton antiporter [Verticiella sediminum]